MSLEPAADTKGAPREGSDLRVDLLTISRRLDGLEPVSEALDRLKGDLASLRESLLGRAEDRGSIALALDRFRSDLADVKVEISSLRANTLLAEQRVDKGILERRAVESALEARLSEMEGAHKAALSEMEAALKGRLEKVEHTGRRFEVFYDSRPLRLLRRIFVGVSGRHE